MLDALDEIAGTVALIALAVATLALLAALTSLRRPARSATQTSPALEDDPSMERYVVAQAERLEQLSAIVTGLTTQAGAWDGAMRHAVQHVGLVRFNPFEDTGGNQSFALALLDADADGIVLSSLHSRTGTRVYVKAILAGRSDAQLSAEEVAALRDAGLAI
jgi:hypothetical protein